MKNTNDFLMEDESQTNYDDIFYLKMVTKKDEDPKFNVKRKVGSVYETLPIEPVSLSGNLKKIEFGEYEWEKTIIKTVKFTIEKEKDGIKQLSILSSSFTSTLRSILNCILSCDKPIETIGFNLFKNKAGYNGCFTLINGKRAEWKYQQDFLKTMIEVEKTKKGELIYYDKLDSFFEDEIMKLMATILPGRLSISDEIHEDNMTVDIDEMFKDCS